MRYMFVIHTAKAEPPTEELLEAMHALAQREVKAGRMIYDGGLLPPAAGAQLRLGNGKVAVLDGPFAETKEIIAGFAVFELPDLAAAIESAREFLELQLRHMPNWEARCEIRQVGGSQVELVRAATV